MKKNNAFLDKDNMPFQTLMMQGKFVDILNYNWMKV